MSAILQSAEISYDRKAEIFNLICEPELPVSTIVHYLLPESLAEQDLIDALKELLTLTLENDNKCAGEFKA